MLNISVIECRRAAGHCDRSSGARRNLQFGPDVGRDLGRVEIYETTDLVVGDAAQLRPVPEGANRGLLAGREDAAGAEAGDVDEVRVDEGSRGGGRGHAAATVSSRAPRESPRRWGRGPAGR